MFNFNFGVKKPSMKDMLIISGILAFVVSTITEFTKIPEKKVWCFVDQITKPLHIDKLEQVKLKIPEVIDCRAKDAVGQSLTPDKIKPYDDIIRKADKKYRPVYQDLPNDDKLCYTDACKALEPPMRICNPVVEGIDDCSRQ